MIESLQHPILFIYIVQLHIVKVFPSIFLIHIKFFSLTLENKSPPSLVLSFCVLRLSHIKLQFQLHKKRGGLEIYSHIVVCHTHMCTYSCMYKMTDGIFISSLIIICMSIAMQGHVFCDLSPVLRVGTG